MSEQIVELPSESSQQEPEPVPEPCVMQIEPEQTSMMQTEPQTETSATEEKPATSDASMRVDDISMESASDSFMLDGAKIVDMIADENMSVHLEDSPYVKSMPRRTSLGQSRKRAAVKDSPLRKPVATKENLNRENPNSSTPHNWNKKWRSASYNPTSTTLNSPMSIASPLQSVENSINNNVKLDMIIVPDELTIPEMKVMDAVQKSDLCPNLIGDFSTTYALPLIQGRHKDLKTITPESLAALIQGEYKEIIDEYTIIDARYPYEYEGGHIQGAKNIFRKEMINKHFFEKLDFVKSVPSKPLTLEKVVIRPDLKCGQQQTPKQDAKKMIKQQDMEPDDIIDKVEKEEIMEAKLEVVQPQETKDESSNNNKEQQQEQLKEQPQETQQDQQQEPLQEQQEDKPEMEVEAEATKTTEAATKQANESETEANKDIMDDNHSNTNNDDNSNSNNKNNNNKPIMKRHAIIFHCEFSSERGPTLYRHLRNRDRELNKSAYPNLHYPEIYLLHGGYKLFYEKFKELCYPQTYLPMHSKDHKQDLRHFRTKSKSWNCERKWTTLRFD